MKRITLSEITKRVIAIIILLFAMSGTGYAIHSDLQDPLRFPDKKLDTENDKAEESKEQKLYDVTKIVDGDTIEVRIDGVLERVRLIGVNTPELKDKRPEVKCFAKRTKEFVKLQLKDMKVGLLPDSAVANREKYGRLLRYAIIPGGGNLNLLLVSEGYAYENGYGKPYGLQEIFKEAQTNATKQKKGLWGDSLCQ